METCHRLTELSTSTLDNGHETTFTCKLIFGIMMHGTTHGCGWHLLHGHFGTVYSSECRMMNWMEFTMDVYGSLWMELATTVYGHNVYSRNTWQWQCINAEWRHTNNGDESNHTRQANGQQHTEQLELLLCTASYDLMNGYGPKLWVLNTTQDRQRYVLHIHSIKLTHAGDMFSLSFTLRLERLLFETIVVDATTWTHAVRWWL